MQAIGTGSVEAVHRRRYAVGQHAHGGQSGALHRFVDDLQLLLRHLAQDVLDLVGALGRGPYPDPKPGKCLGAYGLSDGPGPVVAAGAPIGPQPDLAQGRAMSSKMTSSLAGGALYRASRYATAWPLRLT